MRLERGSIIASDITNKELSIEQFLKSMIEDISHLVFRCFDGTIDQELFSFHYGSYNSVLAFHKELTDGKFGPFGHKDSYSWVLRKKDEYIGACFMTSRNSTAGDVMELVISPGHRQAGYGRLLLTHSLINLFKIEPSMTKIELAVNSENPARLLYESVGFEKANDFSIYVLN
jgi:ribosomal protein S18 acetylase RimI-like enzyme